MLIGNKYRNGRDVDGLSDGLLHILFTWFFQMHDTDTPPQSLSPNASVGTAPQYTHVLLYLPKSHLAPSSLDLVTQHSGSYLGFWSPQR